MEFESGLTIKYSGRVPPLDISNVNVCHHNQTTENDFKWKKIHSILPKKMNSTLNHHHQHNINHNMSKHNGYGHQHNQDLLKTGSDGLPIDPRDWTRADVWKWLINMAISENLDASPDLAQKFPMNGKALCLMSLDMYLSRVPIGGKMLYRDFRVRLAKAMSL